MAIVIVQHVGQRVATGAGTTADFTVASTGAGNLLLVSASNGTGNVNVSTAVSDGTTSFTHWASGDFSNAISPAWNQQIWYLPASNAGKTTITVTMTSSGVTEAFLFWEVSGFTTPATDVATPTAPLTGTGTALAGQSITTTGTGVVVGIVLVQNSVASNPAAGNEFTSGGDVLSSGDAGCSLANSGAGSHQPNWTDSGSNGQYQAVTASWKESAAGGVTLVALIGSALGRGQSPISA